jgi:hypothetical protein
MITKPAQLQLCQMAGSGLERSGNLRPKGDRPGTSYSGQLGGDFSTCAPLQIQRQQPLQDLLIAQTGRPAVGGFVK